ncbi:MAG TPA: hypothetical protein VGB70_12850 [Allosphingosinicella sp.]|jgi:hypothetical protein
MATSPGAVAAAPSAPAAGAPPATPEHNRIKALYGANQIVGSFVEWLEEQGYEICERLENGYSTRYVSAALTTEELLAKHFEIDLQKLEAEKRLILDHFRSVTEQAA